MEILSISELLASPETTGPAQPSIELTKRPYELMRGRLSETNNFYPLGYRAGATSFAPLVQIISSGLTPPARMSSIEEEVAIMKEIFGS